MSIEQFQNSILLFDKPHGWTSFDVVNKVRRVLKAKIGHAGTLDPLATGLLILCTGRETKNMVSFQGLEKEYTGTMTLGATTPSYDSETKVDQTFDIAHITEEMILSAIPNFIGTHDQFPPAHSAKHSEGKRYYQYARKGKEFEMKTHSVTLNEFEITRIEFPEVDFRIVCGKGYYVRSLVYDFGKALGAGAYLTKLCRTRIGQYQLNEAWQIKDFVNFVKEQNETNV